MRQNTPCFFRDFQSASRTARAFRAEVFAGRDRNGPIYSIRRDGNRFLTMDSGFVGHADLASIATEGIA